MPKLNRAGMSFGKLTVLQDSDTSDQLLCQCACGREGNYPRTISKPTYKGRLMCAWCAGSPCVICGTLIPANPGRQAATCSSRCAAEHVKRRGKTYYNSVKDSEHWRAVRAAYLDQLKQRVQSDPGFAHKLAEARRAAVKRYRAKLGAAERARHLAIVRLAARKTLEKIRASGGYPAYLAKNRAWYAALSDEEYERIYGRKRGSYRRRTPA
ncbi:hypothetical protein [Pseudomonas sp. LRF_L74]|uniref:hypothetical protein n=1 Tax=Pseudomonas sp. LRF_L74 TaxID=3369422 RepID=UPI003F5DE951